MCPQRVVITGMGAISPYGHGLCALMQGLASGQSALSLMGERGSVQGMSCSVVGRVPDVNSRSIPREIRRAMSPMSVYAYMAAVEAIAMAKFSPETLPRTTGISVGSTMGSPQTLHLFFKEFLASHSVEQVRSTDFFKVMGHSVAANLALALACTGRALAPAAACASGLVGLGLGYEAIRGGREQYMLCGGADEFHVLTAATFDRMGAASHHSDPQCASRPFDSTRDGIVCSEGAGLLFLESLDSALARKADIIAEIIGFSTSSAPSSIVFPDSAAIEHCMRATLSDAHCVASDIGYINAHATATLHGDRAEGQAIERIFGSSVPVSSLKGHIGHTMAASGALELIASIAMLQEGKCLPTLHLQHADPECGAIHHITYPLKTHKKSLLKNNFALGGIHASVILNVS